MTRAEVESVLDALSELGYLPDNIVLNEERFKRFADEVLEVAEMMENLEELSR